MTLTLANAPCSYGAFEMTDGGCVPGGDAILENVAAAGYRGVDLGPPGLLGSVPDLAANLRRHDLALCGGWVQLPFADPDALRDSWHLLDEVLDLFDAATLPASTTPAPRPTLADGSAGCDGTTRLDAAGFDRLAAGVMEAVQRCGDRGHEPTFHHHIGTYVEAPWEIEELLARTDVGLCLDTGHLIAAGGDPFAALREWGSRINHVHLKDAHFEVVTAVRDAGEPTIEIWKRRAFCPLGQGDLDVDAVLDALRALRYDGWVVVEQDVLPRDADDVALAISDQAASRRYLAARGL
jgi:inosose dehydratase